MAGIARIRDLSFMDDVVKTYPVNELFVVLDKPQYP